MVSFKDPMRKENMADWVSISALILGILAIVLGVGLLIWIILISGSFGQSGALNIVTITGDTTKFNYNNQGNTVLISQSTSSSDLAVTIEANGGAIKGKTLYIVNKGSGKLIASALLGSSVTFPATTLNAGSSAEFILTDTNVYVRMF